MAENKYLSKKLPPNASKGHKQLSFLLEEILNRGAACMTIIYEYPLKKVSEEYAPAYGVEDMHVDFYIKDLNMAVEYQGRQHYHDNGFFSGQKARDEKKRTFLEDLGVTLVEIPDSGKPLTAEQVKVYLGV
jgi:hypothetical protein